MHRLLPKGNYSDRVPVYETAVLEYLREYRSRRGTGPITKRTLPTPPPKLKILNEELRGRVTIAQCSVLLNIPAKTPTVTSGSLLEAQELALQHCDHHHGTDPVVRAHLRTQTQLPNHSRAANLKLITFITKLGKLRDLCPVKLFHLKLVVALKKET